MTVGFSKSSKVDSPSLCIELRWKESYHLLHELDINNLNQSRPAPLKHCLNLSLTFLLLIQIYFLFCYFMVMNYELICLVCENENAHLRLMAFAAKAKIVAISAANGLYIIPLLSPDWNFLTFNFFFMTITWLKFVNFYGWQLNFLAILRFTPLKPSYNRHHLIPLMHMRSNWKFKSRWMHLTAFAGNSI